MSLSPGAKLGPYEILSPLGAGGMGEVYRARDTRLGREVAVKVLPSEFAQDPERLRRFEQEARAAAALNHPNILVLYDIGTHDGAPYIVTELLEGETLRELLRDGPMAPANALDFGIQIAHGLAAAHEKGIVHRDLKPENLFVTKDGRVKILDFGLAQLRVSKPLAGASGTEAPTVDSPTREGMVLGTPGYMAPEQIRGQVADARSDIFTFGVVLYEMLSGRKVFGGTTTSDVAAAVLKEDPPDLLTLAPKTPPILAQLVKRCLEKRPEGRFSSAHDLAIALEAVSGSTPVPSVPVPPAPNPSLWSNRGWILAGGVVVLLTLAGAGLWLWKGRPSRPSAAKPTQAINAIAIFPLDDLSGDAAQSYFAPAMTEALNTKLTQIRSLRVIGQVSAERCKKQGMSLPKVAEVLGVDAVVQGTVVRVGDTVRISVRLLDARTDSNLWADSYERKLSDVLVLQGEVAQAIAASVQATVSPEEKAQLAGRRVNPQAYEEYLDALSDCRKPGNEGYILAIAHLKRAVELDPGFAQAYATLSDYYIGQSWGNYVPYEVAHPLAKEAALKAVEVAPLEATTHATLAYFLLAMERDLPGAERESRRALELDDTNAKALRYYSYVSSCSGRFEEAIALNRRATELDPQNPEVWFALSLSYLNMGRWDEAIRFSERSFDLQQPSARSDMWRAFFQALKGDKVKSLAWIEKAKTFPGWEKRYHTVGYLASTYAVLGLRAEALEALRIREPLCIGSQQEETDLGFVYAWLGERDRAFQHLERACSMPGIFAYDIGTSALYPKEFTRDPRYSALLKKIGMPLPKEE